MECPKEPIERRGAVFVCVGVLVGRGWWLNVS